MQKNKLFVGSLPYTITDEDLASLFAPAGNVVSAKVIMDRDSGRSKGFGFVEFSSDDEAAAAVTQFHGKAVEGRNLTVNIARPQMERPARPRY
jgi:cold-inducible RNA-binding protein